MVLKKLIQHDKLRSAPPYFSQAMLDELNDQEEIKGWLSCNRGAFLLVNMLETGIPAIQKAVAKKVSTLMKFLQRQSNKGADILDAKLANFD